MRGRSALLRTSLGCGLKPRKARVKVTYDRLTRHDATRGHIGIALVQGRKPIDRNWVVVFVHSARIRFPGEHFQRASVVGGGV